MLDSIPVRLILDHHPGFVLINELVGLVGKCHDLAQRFAVVTVLVVQSDLFARAGKRLQQRIVAAGGEPAVKLLVNKASAARRNVDHLADHVRVDPLDEVVEIDIEIIDASTHLRGEVIAYVFRVQMVEIGASIDEGAA